MSPKPRGVLLGHELDVGAMRCPALSPGFLARVAESPLATESLPATECRPEPLCLWRPGVVGAKMRNEDGMTVAWLLPKEARALAVLVLFDPPVNNAVLRAV